MSTSKKQTRVISSFYREYDDFSTLFNYRIFRAGHLHTGPEHHIKRQSVVGHEFIFCLKGKGRVKVEDKLHRVAANQLVWLPVRWPHEHYPDADDPWEIFWLRVDGGKLNNIMSLLEIQKHPVFQFDFPEKMVGIYHTIFGLMRSHTLMSEAQCDMVCANLVFTLLESRSAEALRSPMIMHRGLGQLIYQIHSHYHDDWDIEKFMHFCQVSKSQLFRLFKTTFNQTPLKWLKNYRLSQARRLLVETDASIAAIAYQVGYNDPLHFSRDFHQAVGLSPSEFRRRESLVTSL
ncbi:helix-turn-helix domain-containing protein [Acerihabitans arboris]|uniref:Arabinose operon regulatory protein n=1 Tax=Acerihabitans arboris TaxID=2691583 RepID=A0A845SN18_9GAMM|nr:AraC family transcriptional regulator [Acerihabitans arboris]NDL64607.1 helix-turn-helix domain-containing protein [Acerihabitans arboris]